MVVRSTGFRIMQAQTHALPPPAPRVNALTSQTFLDARVQGLLHRLGSLNHHVPRFTGVKFISHSLHLPSQWSLSWVRGSQLPFHGLSSPRTAGLRSAELPEK